MRWSSQATQTQVWLDGRFDMSRIRKQRSGFTLVELLIVVIILGILAAIVIPQFTNASEDARKGSLSSQLQTLRSQVELYKLQHRDLYPTANGLVSGAWDWTKLTGKTNSDGTTTGSPAIGPYLQSESINGFRTAPASGVASTVAYSSSEVAVGASLSSMDDNDGWVITPSGKIYAISKKGGYVYDDTNPAAANNDN